MCGRFANQQESVATWDEYFDIPMPISVREEVVLGYNIAPTQMIPILTADSSNGNGGRKWLAARWGMIGPWVKDASEISSKFSTFNARSETVSEKATFRGAWNAGRRCLIPALGYYEWKKEDDGKQPYFVHQKKDAALFFGGLYEPARDSDSGSVSASCTFITLPASDAMSPLHHRMPLMFNDPEAWLEGNSFEGHLDDLSWHAVGKTVNNTENQGIELIQCEK
jgi:putative SOS response-associated peptidase YedK